MSEQRNSIDHSGEPANPQRRKLLGKLLTGGAAVAAGAAFMSIEDKILAEQLAKEAKPDGEKAPTVDSLSAASRIHTNWAKFADLKEKMTAATIKGTNRELTEDSLKELKLLCKTAGCEIITQLTQELSKINKATCIGAGKVEEIKQIITDKDIQLIVFDDELSPMQNRNLVKELNIKVMDRSGIILEIFANHAKTQEAKTQVELAHLQYMLPRLTRL